MLESVHSGMTAITALANHTRTQVLTSETFKTGYIGSDYIFKICTSYIAQHRRMNVTFWWLFTPVDAMQIHLFALKEVPQPLQRDRSGDYYGDYHGKGIHGKTENVKEGERDKHPLGRETLVGVVAIHEGEGGKRDKGYLERMDGGEGGQEGVEKGEEERERG